MRGLEVDPTADDALAVATEAAAERAYVVGVRLWRSTRFVVTTSVMALLMGALPLLPNAEAAVGVPAWITLTMMGSWVVVGVVAWAWLRHGDPLGPVYRVLSWADAVVWCGGLTTIILVSGRAVNPYWLGLFAFVMLMSPNVYRARDFWWVLMGCAVGMVAGFAASGLWFDAVLSALGSGTLLLGHRLAMRYGWERHRQAARADLLAKGLAEARAAQERERITRDLHDGLAADLTAVLWRAQAMDDEGAHALVGSVRQSLDTLRQIIHAVADQPLTVRRLVVEARRSVEALETSGVRIDVRGDSDPEARAWPPEICEAVLRVVQEGVRNAVQHGSASHVVVSLTDAGDLLVAVRDDGKGMPSDPVAGHGLRNLLQRAEELGGACTWTPVPGGGTEVRWRVPYSM